MSNVSSEVIEKWVPLNRAGQIKVGDWLRFLMAGRFISAQAKLVLNAGTAKEEIIYNRKKNHYFITSMALDGTSSHKDVMVGVINFNQPIQG